MNLSGAATAIEQHRRELTAFAAAVDTTAGEREPPSSAGRRKC